MSRSCAIAMLLVATAVGHAAAVDAVPLKIAAARRVAVPLGAFLGESIAFEDALEAALADAAARSATAAAATDGMPVRTVVEIPPGRHLLRRPIAIRDRGGIGIDGGGGTLVQTQPVGVFEIERCRDVVITNLAIDYDPLPFTQGVVTEIDPAGTTVDLAVDPGYRADATFAARLRHGMFHVLDRERECFAVGGRYALQTAAGIAPAAGMLRITLAWSSFECGPGQRRLARGDAVVVTASGPSALMIRDSDRIGFVDCGLHAAPGFGMMFQGGAGATVLERVRVVPGPPPAGSGRARLCSTNADGTHFNCVDRGPTIAHCAYKLTGDDPVNVHGFYWFVVGQAGPRVFALSPRQPLGLQVGDTVDAVDRETLAGKGQAVVVAIRPRPAGECAAGVARVWAGRAPPLDSEAVHEVAFDRDLDLAVGDALASRDRCGAGTVIRDSTFHGGGRVMIKTHDALVENNTFEMTNAAALHVGSDIGYWAESSFAQDVTIRGNTFRGCGRTANPFFSDADAFATVFVGCTHAAAARHIPPCQENKRIVIEGNRIEDSLAAAIQIMNADGVLVRGNTIGRTFLRGSGFAAGSKFGLVPDAAVVVLMSRSVTLEDNEIATGDVARRRLSIDAASEGAVRETPRE